jgi:hypothetical protein
MPRGSKPGERRGGRQKGTPNKKTVLRNAGLSAAAADPNVSPLDCLLNVMRSKRFPWKPGLPLGGKHSPIFTQSPENQSLAKRHRVDMEMVPLTAIAARPASNRSTSGFSREVRLRTKAIGKRATAESGPAKRKSMLTQTRRPTRV